MYLKRTKNRSVIFFLFLFTILLFTACPEDPKPKPVKADCPPGYLPCEDDSTICCEVICPPGYILGGEDSTECIPVECPEYYHLCGDDSTDCCLDTSSHDINWEVQTVMDGIGDIVYDIAILNDTLVWAVGEFVIPDTTGNMTSFQRSFNLVEWNGSSWELKKVFNPNWAYSIGGLRSVYAINSNDIWVGGPFHYDGETWQFYRGEDGWPYFDGYINAIWASGPDDVFFISDGGQINHWNGAGFERMDTPTTTRLSDIWGTDPNNVWAVGYDVTDATTTLIHYNGIEWLLKYAGDRSDWYARDTTRLSGVIKSIFTHCSDSVFVLSNPNGIYSTSNDSSPLATLQSIDLSWQGMRDMHGLHGNDLFICGNHSGLAHYNGKSVFKYPINGEIDFYSIDVRYNLVSVIGPDLDEGNIIVLLGNR